MRSVLRTLCWLSSSLLWPAAGTAQSEGAGPAIAWQRTLADALAVQKATGLPLLVAVNMDGEVFNERFAGTTYKDPEFVALTRGYVCLVCSPDRHTERDHDAAGNRVECPRFPGVTCSEHISVEPLVFERFFHGTRNAPRHVGVSPEGKVLFDRFLDQSMQTAIDAIRKHGAVARGKALPDSVTELFARRDAAARTALEHRFRTADTGARKALLASAAHATNEPIDLLRMALRADDAAVFQAGAAALAATATKDHATDVEDALARCDDPRVSASLLERLEQVAAGDPAAAQRASMLRSAQKVAPLPAPWGGRWRATAFDANDRASIEAELDRCEVALGKQPDDAEQRLRLATAQAAFARVLIRDGGKGADLWLEDCVRTARLVTGDGPRAEAHAVLAHAHWLQGDPANAEAAARLADPLPVDRVPDAMVAARFLDTRLLLAASRVFAATKEQPVADLPAVVERTLAILELLAARNAATEEGVLAGGGLIEFVGLRQRARAEYERALHAFPASERLHERWRNRVLFDLGADELRRQYDRFASGCSDGATAQWFAGYAALVAAERHTKDQRPDRARKAYDDSVERFEKAAAANEAYLDTAHHFAVLALAGRAAVRSELGDGEGAVADLLRAASLREASLDDSDGLARKPRGIASRVVDALEKQGKSELAAQLKPLLP